MPQAATLPLATLVLPLINLVKSFTRFATKIYVKYSVTQSTDQRLIGNKIGLADKWGKQYGLGRPATSIKMTVATDWATNCDNLHTDIRNRKSVLIKTSDGRLKRRWSTLNSSCYRTFYVVSLNIRHKSRCIRQTGADPWRVSSSIHVHKTGQTDLWTRHRCVTASANEVYRYSVPAFLSQRSRLVLVPAALQNRTQPIPRCSDAVGFTTLQWDCCSSVKLP